MEKAQIIEYEAKALEIMRRCPKFERCSAPRCPLDLLEDERTILRGEPKCSLRKKTRLQIAKDIPLPRKGLTKKEWAGIRSWEVLGDAVKTRIQSNLTPFASNCPRVLKRKSGVNIKTHPGDHHVGNCDQLSGKDKLR